MDISIEIENSESIKTNLKSFLHDRQNKMVNSTKQHSYLINFYSFILNIIIILFGAVNITGFVLATVFKSENKLVPEIFSGVNLLLLGITMKYNIYEKPSLHKQSKLMAEDIHLELEHALVRERTTLLGLQSLSDIYEEKIKSFRIMEERVPFWVKQKILKNG